MSVGILGKRDDKPRKPKPNPNTDPNYKPDKPPKPCSVIGALFFQGLHHRVKAGVQNARQLIARSFVEGRHVVQQIGVRYRIVPRRSVRLLLLLAFLLLPLHLYAQILSN